MKNILLAILFLAIVSCGNDTKKEVKTDKKKEVIVEEPKKELEVVINFKTNKTDEFKLMLNNIRIDEFQRKNIHIIEKVEPSTLMEELTAKFGENNILNNFNINFGAKEVKKVKIEFINISYGENTLNISGNDLSDYFTINKYITYDNATGTLQTQKIEGKHYPTIILKRKVINSLTKK